MSPPLLRHKEARADPARPTVAEARSAWAWLRTVPRASWQLVRSLLRTERRLAVTILGVVALVCAVLALLGAGGNEIWEIVATLGLVALIEAVSREHRTSGAVVVAILLLSLLGTLAGPRWSPAPLRSELAPSTADTRIGGSVVTAPVGRYKVLVSTVIVSQPDGTQAPAKLRQPRGVTQPTPGVVFLHGAGTHSIDGFAQQAEALASAGVTTLVPTKPVEGYSLTQRDYLSMATSYHAAVDYLRSVSSVDPARVGLYAESEGGFPGVVMAAEDQRIAFLVLASAPVVQIRQQATYAAGTYLEHVGVPDALLTVVARLLGARQIPGGFDYADFDARDFEKRLTQPVLMLYGTADSSMPIVQGPMVISEAMRSNGNDQLTVRYYKGANHGLKLGNTTDGLLAPGVARDLSRWVAGLPATGWAEPHVAGDTPVQDFWARAPGSARWYASGDLMLGGFALALSLLVCSAVGWVLGQVPRLWGGRGLYLPSPIGRWSVSLGLAVCATWVLYLAYIVAVARLAVSYRTDPWVSYGGWAAAQTMAVIAVIIAVKLVVRIILVRDQERTGQDTGGRWLTAPALLVLSSALAGAGILLVLLAYWGLFPLLF